MAKIYLSATYQDLKPHRDAVYRILRMLRHDVISMEDYVAMAAYPLHKCLADVASSDIYVGLLGWRYGYILERDNPQRSSITELEYRQAGESGLPQLLFVADPQAPWPDEFKDAQTGDGDHGQRIAAFRAGLEKGTLVSYFRTPDHLAGLVSVAVQQCLTSEFATGRQTTSSIREVKNCALQARVQSLLQDYSAATEQLAFTLSAVDRGRIERQIHSLEQELERLEQQIDYP